MQPVFIACMILHRSAAALPCRSGDFPYFNRTNILPLIALDSTMACLTRSSPFRLLRPWAVGPHIRFRDAVVSPRLPVHTRSLSSASASMSPQDGPRLSDIVSEYRSLLFVPADSDRKLRKSVVSGADACLLDLEDGVAHGRKVRDSSATYTSTWM